jgi:hypothetical protein
MHTTPMNNCSQRFPEGGLAGSAGVAGLLGGMPGKRSLADHGLAPLNRGKTE